MSRFVIASVVLAASVTICLTGCQQNRPPSVPEMTGDTAAMAGQPVFLGLMSTDPEGQQVAYLIDWGEELPSTWTDWMASGQWFDTSHAYAEPGIYHIMVKARDESDAASVWSTERLVTVAEMSGNGGPPRQVMLTPDSDSTVLVFWERPAEGTPDRYGVLFLPVGGSAYDTVIRTNATAAYHDPHGRTGNYKVFAQFGPGIYESPTILSTIPVHTDTTLLTELNRDPARSGYGWDRTTGTAGIYSMADAGSAPSVDFYVTDFDTGYGHVPYAVLSPDQADTVDRGAQGIVPPAGWRTNGFSNPLTDENAPLPAYSQSPYNYFIYSEISGLPTLIACYTAGESEKHYGLIKVVSVEPDSGTVTVESWFQPLPDFRLIEH